MGTFSARVGVSDGNGGPTEWVDALVDTGATYTVLPDAILRDRVGVQPKEHQTFTFADGAEALLPVGDATVHIEGREIPNRVVFGDEGQYLLGAPTLQVFGLVADTSNHCLVAVPSLPGSYRPAL